MSTYSNGYLFDELNGSMSSPGNGTSAPRCLYQRAKLMIWSAWLSNRTPGQDKTNTQVEALLLISLILCFHDQWSLAVIRPLLSTAMFLAAPDENERSGSDYCSSRHRRDSLPVTLVEVSGIGTKGLAQQRRHIKRGKHFLEPEQEAKPQTIQLRRV